MPGLKDAVRELMNSHLDDLMNMTNIQAMRFDLSAMAIALPDESHPNRLPFSGVLTKVGEPSDNPPDGANGRRVLIPTDVAEKALDSLAAMGVDFTADYSGHDPTKKIGVITAAEIEGNDLTISGFFYAQDFPDEVAFIQANKDRLGFSYEAQVMVEDQNANPLTVSHCVFTGAAVLFKDKAAYTTTSLQASKDSTQMDEQLKAALEAITQSVAGLAAEVATIKASATVQAGSVLHKVKPHSDALRACADKLEADGIGADPKRGHVAVLRHMADSMEASACTGNLPNIYTGGDFYYASAEQKAYKKVAELEKTVDDLSAKLEAAATVAADAKKAAFNAASAPDRKTVSPVIAALLKKGGITLEASGDNKLNDTQLDAVMKASGANTPAQRMAKKLELQAAYLL
ncbi:hypothetical protein [Paludibacterium denitrificans]|uniref:Uncharacterized protein n=1 Tax=Paludibacterium denitrificans TaxID=2675226 RepID=A0A844GE37_9NEIS|nr:hypothetical protein [Paludibacterium denitrificans]MTD34022.1 hypothetical protein [Paludibacterium denitrificans]